MAKQVPIVFLLFIFVYLSNLRASPLDTWHVRSAEPAVTETLGDVIYGGGTFVAVGNRGVVVASNDGIAWKQQRTPLSNFFPQYTPSDNTPIAYGRGLFVAVGDFGEIFTSTNGLNWESRDSNWAVFSDSRRHSTLTAAQAGHAGLYDALVSNRVGTQTSAPARLTVAPDPRAARLAIRYSSSSKQLELVLVGTIGAYYEIESRDQVAGLEAWQPAAFVEEIEDSVVWPIPQFTNETARFYRAVLLE